MVPNCPGAKLSAVPNCPRCQIVRGAKLSMVPNCPRTLGQSPKKRLFLFDILPCLRQIVYVVAAQRVEADGRPEAANNMAECPPTHQYPFHIL